jgi:hypothetical protein
MNYFEIEAEHTRRKTNSHKAMSHFYAELRRQAKGEVQTLEINTEEARIIREQILGLAQSQELRLYRKNASKLEELIQNPKEHQEHGVHCDLWVQRLASSKSFKTIPSPSATSNRRNMPVFSNC